MICPQCNFTLPSVPYKPIVNTTTGNDTGSGSGNPGVPDIDDGGNGNETDNETEIDNETMIDNGTVIENGTNIDNETITTNGTDVNNSTVNSTDNTTEVEGKWNPTNYTLPKSC